MSVFAYGRVSTTQQSTENQRLEITNTGFQIDYWVIPPKKEPIEK